MAAYTLSKYAFVFVFSVLTALPSTEPTAQDFPEASLNEPALKLFVRFKAALFCSTAPTRPPMLPAALMVFTSAVLRQFSTFASHP